MGWFQVANGADPEGDPCSEPCKKRKVESWWQEASAGEHCGNGSGPGRQEEQPGAGEEAGGGGNGFCRLIPPKVLNPLVE